MTETTELVHGDTVLAGSDPRPAGPKGETGPLVAILLSTFNGARYLGAQLDSFTAQYHHDWRLYWRDDGSSDGSGQIVEAFAAGAGEQRCVRAGGLGRMDAATSFLTLLRQALPGGAALFAFSDQDDVWLPGKLTDAAAALSRVEADRPALYFCARTLVDSGLRPIGPSPALRRPPGFPASLTQNVIPGCCMILNRAAAELVCSVPIPERAWHDWWCYLLVTAADGVVLSGETPGILYRQHDRNLVGEPLGRWRRLTAAARRGRHPFVSLLWRHVAAMRGRPAPWPPATQKILDVMDQASRGGLLARLRALAIPGLRRQTALETLVFRLWLILG